MNMIVPKPRNSFILIFKSVFMATDLHWSLNRLLD
jgi:hypothetical protein